MSVTLFKSTDTGAPTLSGTAGDLVKVLDECLCIGRMFSLATPSTFTDNSVEARLNGGATFTFFPGPTISDIAYFGGAQKFAQVIINMATLGIGGTYAFEYWNGSAWTALISPTDGTSGLTANGMLSWAIASQTGWATTAINGITLFWVRIRCVTTPSTNPLVNTSIIYGWTNAYSGTNGRTYRSALTSGVQHWFTINDNGPGLGTGKECRIWGNESDPGSYLTGPTASPQTYPTTVQAANGWFIRKSTTADATTRVWKILMDEKTAYIFVRTADVPNQYFTAGFGEFFSLLPGDLYRSFVSARITENSGSTNGSGLCALTGRSQGVGTGIDATGQSIAYARQYTGLGSAFLACLICGLPVWNSNAGGGGGGQGPIGTFNGPDGGMFTAPVWAGEPTTFIRGRLRGLWDWGHLATSMVDNDVFQGTGAISTKAFTATFACEFNNGVGGRIVAGMFIMETSDTWESN